MADLITNINQAIADFSAIKQAIIDKNIDVPDGTPTSRYGELIENIQTGENLSELLPKSIGLTHFFDYQNGVDITNKTWTDRVSGVVCTADGDFNVSENCLEMDGKAFSLGYGEGLSAHTIYAIVCAKEYVSGWMSFIAAYGDTPQFNLCNYSGKLAIGAGVASGIYKEGTIPAYDEWHVCCITADEGFGAFYIDGIMKYSYNGYAKPQYTNQLPLYFGYGNIKMMAVCPNVAHSEKIVAENSEYLKSKYIE